VLLLLLLLLVSLRKDGALHIHQLQVYEWHALPGLSFPDVTGALNVIYSLQPV
jgi:hypothetical protein